MIDWTVEVPRFDGAALRFEWTEDYRLSVRTQGDEVVIQADAAGLETLARHLLTLAQPGVGSGSHLHLDANCGLETGSGSLVVEREDDPGENQDWVRGSASSQRRCGDRPRQARPRGAHQVTTMPRSGDEILAHADQLAGRFEHYDPEPGDELNREAVTALRAAVQERPDDERHVLDAVRGARQAGLPWSAIGSLVGTTGEAARQRYGRGAD